MQLFLPLPTAFAQWNYALRVTDLELTTEVLQPLENAINSAFVPALTGLPAPGN